MPWHVTVGFGLMALPVVLTLFHAVIDGKKKNTIWYFGDGYGNVFEDIVRLAAGTDYRSNKKRYIATSIFVRLFLLSSGLAIISFHSIKYVLW